MASRWEGASWSSRQGDGDGGGSGVSRERDGEREPLAPSSGKNISHGATDNANLTADAAAAAAAGPCGGPRSATTSPGGPGSRAREAKARSSPRGFFRGMMTVPAAVSARGRQKKQQQMAAATSAEVSLPPSPRRTRAMTSAAGVAAWTDPSDEAGIGVGARDRGFSPTWKLERRSSAGGYEGLPEIPKPLPGNAAGQADTAGADGTAVALPKRRSVRTYAMSEEETLTRAITFLEDALGYRDPDYYTDPGSMRSYRLRQSRAWQSCTSLAVVAYIAACFLGKPPFSADWDGMPPPSALQTRMGQTWGLCLECGCVVFFSFDIWLLYRCVGARAIWTSWWKAAFVLSLVLSMTDLGTRWFTHRPWSRVFRPAVFFFVGPKVRNCSISTLKAVSALLPVLVLELLVTLAYACVCVVLFHGVKGAPFTTLGSAFVNLFALSTTVNDPDVWMPLYDRNRANVLVFVSFLVVQVFLLHNILLASVWNEFGERMKVYAKQKRKWRDESVRRAFEALDVDGAGYITRETVMRLLETIRPHYGESKRYMMYERIVQSATLRGRGGGQAGGGRGRMVKEYEAADVALVYRKDFCSNVVEALSLKIRTIHERRIASTGQYLLGPLYFWNMAFVVVSCAMSPWVFHTGIFWLTLLPTSALLGASVLVELVMTGVRAYLILPWNRVKTLSLSLTATGLFWLVFFTSPGDWGGIVAEDRREKREGAVHMQVSIALLMSARCLDLGSLLKLVPAIHDVVSVMYVITPSVFAQAGVIFTIFHLYCYLGMALYGGVVTPGADFGDTPFANSPYYYENNFNSYPEGLVTLFELLIVNNWNIVITGYIHASPLGMWTYLYFLSFITLAVSLALNVLTAIFMTAFTTAAKSNNTPMPAGKGGGALGQSMTSDKARTALRAGAMIALQPTPTAGSYFSSQSDLRSGMSDSGAAAISDFHNRTRSYNIDEEEVDTMLPPPAEGGEKTAASAAAGGGGGGSGGGWYGIFGRLGAGLLGPVKNKSGGGTAAGGDDVGGGRAGAAVMAASPDPGGDRTRKSGDAAATISRRGENEIPPPPPRSPSTRTGTTSVEHPGADSALVSASTRFPDPLQPQQQQLHPSRLSGLPENEEVVPVEGEKHDLDLGWGQGSAEPPLAAAIGGRARWGSGNFYNVSRRNSYSDRDMFEGGREDEQDVPMKILGAVSVGLGNTVGIRACMLRHKETRTRGNDKKEGKGGAWHRDGYGESSVEDELEHPESHLMFESNGFRRMVAPHLPLKPGGQALGLAGEDEGWEAMAMRDELTDVMLHRAFGEAIYKECPRFPDSPELGSSRSGTPGFGSKIAAAAATVTAAADSAARKRSPASPRSTAFDGEGGEEEEEGFDLPKDLGIRTWTKSFKKEERAKGGVGLKSKTAILSVQCVLAAREPPVVVYTARTLQ